MKKLALFLVMALLLSCLVACGDAEDTDDVSRKAKETTAATTVATEEPQADVQIPGTWKVGSVTVGWSDDATDADKQTAAEAWKAIYPEITDADSSLEKVSEYFLNALEGEDGAGTVFDLKEDFTGTYSEPGSESRDVTWTVEGDNVTITEVGSTDDPDELTFIDNTLTYILDSAPYVITVTFEKA